jgi:hypothetical protein
MLPPWDQHIARLELYPGMVNLPYPIVLMLVLSAKPSLNVQ